jgi:hypothetical protein
VLNVQSRLSPRLGWLVSIGDYLGVSEHTVLWSAWAGLLCAGCCLFLGLFCRPAAAMAWFLHLCAVKSEELLAYGMDNFTTIGLFYLMLSPLPDRYSIDARIWGRRQQDPRMLGFFRRVLQLHLCISYFLSGIMKALGAEWWNGTSIWHVLSSPPFNLVSPHVLADWKALLPFVGMSVILLETGYPLFIWPRKTRLIWLIGICGMHLAIAATMGLYLFSFVMIVLNLAAFAPPFPWRHNAVVSVLPKEGIA